MYVSGIVTDVQEREVSTRFGLKKSYSVSLDNGQRYGAGFKHPGVRVGDAVQFEHKGDTYNTVIGTISKIGAPPPVSPGSMSPTTAPLPTSKPREVYSRPFPIPPLHGDRAIIRQNAMTHAVAICLHSLPKAEATADYLSHVDFVIQMARRIEAYSAGDLDLEAAEAAVAEGAAGKAA